MTPNRVGSPRQSARNCGSWKRIQNVIRFPDCDYFQFVNRLRNSSKNNIFNIEKLVINFTAAREGHRLAFTNN